MGERTPLRFAFWDVGAPIVRANVARHEREAGETVTALCVADDYEETIGHALAEGTGPDVFHAQRAAASLWADHGLIRPLEDDHPSIAPLIARMDTRLVAGARDADGRLLGTTYYNGGPFALFLRPGSDRPVESWDAVLELCRRAKRDGVATHPFVPRWHRSQTGLIWSLLCHLAAEGVTGFSDPGAEAALSEALRVFLSLHAEGLTPPGSLDDTGDRPAVARWAHGNHVATFTTDYLAADAAALAGRPVSLPAARLPGRAGTPLMPGHALICVRAGLDAPRRGRAIRLAAFLGGTAKDGSLAVHRRWLTECLFAVPYPELMRDPIVLRELERFFAPDDAETAIARLDAARAAAVVSPISHRPFMLAWSAAADTVVREDVLRARRVTPGQAARRLLGLWDRLDTEHRRHASA